MKIISIILVMALTWGCASVVSQPFTVAGLACEAVEVRPSTLSTITVATCTQDGKAMNLVSAQGTPQISVALEGMGQAISIGQGIGAITLGVKAATILGKSLEQAGKNIEKPWPARTCTNPKGCSED